MPKPNPTTLAARGQRLAAARAAKQVTQQQAAKHLGVDVSTVTRIEQGSTDPSEAQLRALCDLYGVTVDSILSDP